MLESLHLSPFVIAPLAIAVVLVLVLLAVGKVPLGYNIRNLLVRWWITFLTAFAFTLVVGLLTVMLAFVNGMYRLTENSGNPGNVMILSDGATDELFSNLAKSDTTNIERQKGVDKAMLKDADQQEREYPLCSKEVYIVVNQPIPPALGPAGSTEFRGKIKTIVQDKGEFTLVDDTGVEKTFRPSDNPKFNIHALKADDLVFAAYDQQ